MAVEIKHATLTSELGGSKVGATEWDEAHTVPVASQAEAEAGTNDSKLMTPERTAQAIAALAPGGGGGSVDWGDIGGTLGAQTDLAAALAGYQPLATVLTNTTASFTTAKDTKLSGIATGATANDTDANLKNRANHTGTQAVSTILAASSSRFFGRITASGGAGEELTGTQATTLLDTFTSALKGLTPASGGGTSNFLRADGTWAEPASEGGTAGLVFLSEQIVSSAVAAVDFTSGIDSTYDEYELHFQNVLPASNSAFLLRTSSNGGSSFDSGSNEYAYQTVSGRTSALATVTGGGSSGATSVNMTAMGTTGGASGKIILLRPLAGPTFRLELVGRGTTGEYFHLTGVGARLGATTVNAIRLQFDGPNIASGLFRLYGVAKQ